MVLSGHRMDMKNVILKIKKSPFFKLKKGVLSICECKKKEEGKYSYKIN